MSRQKFAIHFLIIISMLFTGIASAHICMDDGEQNNTSASLIFDQSDDSSSDIAFDCCESSCHHNCNHLFSLGQNLSSELTGFVEKNIVDSYKYSLPLNYVSLPSKPPKA
jgi:hypothetical protein